MMWALNEINILYHNHKYIISTELLLDIFSHVSKGEGSQMKDVFVSEPQVYGRLSWRVDRQGWEERV